jgi:hypothetical protein
VGTKAWVWFRKHRNRIGIALTFTWLVGFALWTLLWEPPRGGNEWGDWAAGMFAPVAFFWLVLGYFQQGDELRLQAIELHESVRQQGVMASAAVAAHRPWLAITSAEPRDVKFSANGARIELTFSVRNAGSTPAVRCDLWAMAIPSGPDATAAVAEVVRAVHDFAKQMKGQPGGSIVLPNEVDVTHYGLDVDQSALKTHPLSGPQGAFNTFQVAVLVEYTFANGGEGRTEQLFSLRRILPNMQSVPFNPASREPQGSGLVLSPTSSHRVML